MVASNERKALRRLRKRLFVFGKSGFVKRSGDDLWVETKVYRF